MPWPLPCSTATTPTIVLGRSEVPLLTPELSWEREGFFPNVVFSNGWVQWPDGRIWVYYGAADSGVGVARTGAGLRFTFPTLPAASEPARQS